MGTKCVVLIRKQHPQMKLIFAHIWVVTLRVCRRVIKQKGRFEHDPAVNSSSYKLCENTK